MLLFKKYDNIRFCNEERAAIGLENNEIIKKLLELVKSFEKMPSTARQKKSLTKDNSMGLSHTCRALVHLENCLLKDYKISYVMFGLFTSDLIEKQFNKLRQGSGGTYFITVQQILEKVVIRKTKLLLKIGFEIDGLSCHSCSKCGFLLNESIFEVINILPELQKTQRKSVSNWTCYQQETFYRFME